MIAKQAIKWPLWFIIVLAACVIVDLVIKLAVPVNSNDLWWHIVLGRQILDSGSLILDHSIYTWTPATAQHTYNTWLSDIILYLVDKTAGIAGLLALRYGIFIAIFLFAIAFAVSRNLHRHPLTWTIILIGMGLSGTGDLIKPEIFSLGFMTLMVWLYYTIRGLGDRAWRYTYLMPLILIVWVNSHGAFFIISIFLASTLIGELLNLKYYSEQAMSERLRRHYFIAILLCVPAIMINPYGIELPINIIDLVINKNASDYGYISAYQPTFILNKPPHYMLDYLILAMVLFVLLLWQKMKLRQTDWVVILSFVIYSALFTEMIRTTYFLAPIFIFSSLDMLSTRSDSIFWSHMKAKKYSIALLSVVIIAAMSYRIIYYGREVLVDPVGWFERLQFVGYRFPQAESGYIASHLEGKRIGNLYGDGGYLLYRHWPEKKVMIDPRYFPFKSWIDDYMNFAVVGQGTSEFVQSIDADFWLINYDKIKPLEWFGSSDQWSLAFFGPVGAIFVPTDQFNGNTTYSAHIKTLSYISQLTKVLSAAAIVGDLALAEEVRAIAERNIKSSDKYKSVYLVQMDNFIQGFRYLSKQDLVEAAAHFSNAGSFSYGLELSAKIYRYLASVAWQKGDYIKARQWSFSAYEVLPTKTIPDIYNLALTSWHVKNSIRSDSKVESDGFGWEFFVDILLEKRYIVTEEQRKMLDIAEAMKSGDYKGDAKLFQQIEYEKIYCKTNQC